MQIICWLACFLIHKALAVPTAANPFPNAQSPNSPDVGAILNTTLVGDDPPWGPTFFSVDLDAGSFTTAIDRRIFFLTTIQILASQAYLDFNGALPGDIVFRLPQFPTLVIAVYNTGPARPILRKYLFWAMTRIMKTMIMEDRWLGALFAMKLRGRVLGIVAVGDHRFVQSAMRAQQRTPRIPIEITYEDIITTMAEGSTPAVAANGSNATELAATNNNNNRIEFEYDHFGEQMGQAAIFMGSITAMFKIAGETGHDFESFISTFLEYRITTCWTSNTSPSRFTFTMLIQAIVGAAKYAVAKNVWLELSGQVFVDRVSVAFGGWFVTRLPPAQRLASS
ncbi:MAG: hypothetical protein LQ339_004211 [Xanthoria mediterranea]|nr:MAG: hypothetical protein LQ339_004211 [Xanthoria mediterranea]